MVNVRRGKEGAVEFEGNVAASGSDEARVSWSPRRRELLVGGGSTMSKLMRREIGGLSGRPDFAFCAEKFRRFKLQEEFPLQADMEFSPWVLRSIAKIIPANDFIFAIDQNGFSVALHQTANDSSIAPYKKDGRIWYFNNFSKMESIFYNKINDSIITVSSSMTKGGYKMRAIPLQRIRRCDDWGSGTKVFGSRTCYLPIFDNCNNLAIISFYPNGRNMVNNIYETNNYELVHSIHGEIHSITTRPGIMIVAYRIFCNALPVKVFSTENWVVLEEFSYLTPPIETLQFVELCYENILVKQNDQKMHIIDLWDYSNVTTIENSELERLPLGFDLIANNVLLKFKNDMVLTCNSRGEQVPLLDNVGNASNYSTIHINVTRDKNFCVLYSRKPIENPGKRIYNRKDAYNGKINIYSTFNGNFIVEVNPCGNIDLPAATHNDSGNNTTNEAPKNSAREALNNVTALYYDEEHHRIFTGNKSGLLHVWST